MTDRSLGLYVHFPFCRSKCAYCDFPSEATDAIPDAGYRDAVIAEIGQRAARFGPGPLTTVFFGGGTPSLWAPASVAAVIAAAREALGLQKDAEITLEANPGTVDAPRLRAFRDAGINRLSLGVQCFDDLALASIGRIHDRAQAEQAVAAAREAGLDNLGLDLIFGLPGQGITAWCDTLDRALALRPEHLSLYQLTLARGTPLHDAVQRGEIRLPDEDAVAEMLVQGVARTDRAGYLRYEVSNLARPDRACRHNQGYWTGGEYLGVGAGASSFRRVGTGLGEREINSPHPEEYLADRLATAERETLGPDELVRERLLTGLRLVEGVDLDALAEEIGRDPLEDRGEEIEELEREGLISLAGERLAATERGLMFADALALRLSP